MYNFLCHDGPAGDNPGAGSKSGFYGGIRAFFHEWRFN
jgi:hypothetical protein